MKNKIILTKRAFYLWAILFALLGTCTSLITYKYIVVARGILGFLVIYLTVQYGRYLRVAVPIDELLLYPKIYKSFVYIFAGAIISSWAIQEIYKMIFFLVENIALLQR